MSYVVLFVASIRVWIILSIGWRKSLTPKFRSNGRRHIKIFTTNLMHTFDSSCQKYAPNVGSKQLLFTLTLKGISNMLYPRECCMFIFHVWHISSAIHYWLKLWHNDCFLDSPCHLLLLLWFSALIKAKSYLICACTIDTASKTKPNHWLDLLLPDWCFS